jgi:hypothetical protein
MNMTKDNLLEKLQSLPEKSRKAIADFTIELAEAFGDSLKALILYGSAARTAAGGHPDDFKEGSSNINLAIVLAKVTTVDLNIILNVGRNYKKANLALPLVFRADHIPTSLDTFPLEFSDMQQHHVCLHGKDPLEKVVIEKGNLRYQCEFQFKGTLVNLRRGYLAAGENKENLSDLLAGSVSSIITTCRGLVRIKDQEPPDSIVELLNDVKDDYGVDITPIERVWQLKRGEAQESTATLQMLFDSYMITIEKLASLVDGM